MTAKTVTIRIRGMSCPSCEGRVESALRAVDGVSYVKADSASGEARLRYDDDVADPAAFAAALAARGYVLVQGPDRGPIAGLAIGLLLAAGYISADRLGLFTSIPELGSTIGFGALLSAGLLTSVHCVGMCGGIALSQAARAFGPMEEGRPGPVSYMRRLSPSLLYNTGRIISYTVLGAAIGGLGSILDFSMEAKALLMAVAALFMVLFGLKNLGLRLPTPIQKLLTPFTRGRSKGIAAWASARGPLTVGLANGFMPCGPLQAMQLYALGTGDALKGGLSMFLFAIGTVPLMLGLGAAAAWIPRRLGAVASRASAVLVIALGLVTGGRAAALAGIALPAFGYRPPREATPAISLASDAAGTAVLADLFVPVVYSPAGAAGPRSAPRPASQGPSSTATEVIAIPGTALRARSENGVQTIITPIGSRNYTQFIVQKGIPVRWILRARAQDLNGCNNPIVIPSLGIKRRMAPGDTVIEFTPDKTGTYVFSCWMGMVVSRYHVVESLASLGPDEGRPY
jgi:sulfite exporter TauE/SafE/copper chaperone CopZ